MSMDSWWKQYPNKHLQITFKIQFKVTSPDMRHKRQPKPKPKQRRLTATHYEVLNSIIFVQWIEETEHFVRRL